MSGFGDTEKKAGKHHDRNLEAFLKRAREKNLKLNEKKMKLRLTEVPFIGHLLTAERVKIDPKKVEAVINMPERQNVKELMRFIGMVQYLSKFLSRLSDIMEPLRRLTDKDAEWQWSTSRQKIINEDKQLVPATPVLAYYYPASEVTIQADASQTGLGATPLQKGRPVEFSSRALTPTEQRYAQIEKETLAIVHACTKFDQYRYDKENITVESDHKPLESIFKKDILKSPKRLQRMLLFLQKYDLKVTYKKGTEMYIADTLSRAFLKTNSESENSEDVFSMREATIIKTWEKVKKTTGHTLEGSKGQLHEIRSATRNDEELQEEIDIGWLTRQQERS